MSEEVSPRSVKQSAKLQAKVDKVVFVTRIAATSKLLGRAATDEEFFTLLTGAGIEITHADITRCITTLLKDGAFIESATKVHDATGKRLVRQTGIREVVPDGVEIAEQRAAAAAQKLSELAGGLAVHLSTSLRRRHNADIPVPELQKRVLEALEFLINKEKSEMATTAVVISESLTSDDSEAS